MAANKKPASSLEPGDTIVVGKTKGTILRGPRASPKFSPGRVHFEVQLEDGVYSLALPQDDEIKVL